MPEIKPVLLDNDIYFYSLSFDVDEWIGNAIWWLQIYDSDKQMIYDKPFADSLRKPDEEQVYEIIFAILRPWGYASNKFDGKRFSACV